MIEFWNPSSGFIGGFIFAFVVSAATLISLMGWGFITELRKQKA